MARIRTPQGSPLGYSIGFAFSIALTLLAYAVVVHHAGSVWALSAIVLGFGALQMFVQLYYFLHVADRDTPRWNVVVLLFALLVVIIIVIGSIWIMNNLNYRMTSPDDVTSSIIHDEGIQR